jgi:fatty acid desaturase
MLQPAPKARSLWLARARHMVADLFVPKPWIYWTDFLVSAAIGNAAVAVYLLAVRDWAGFLPSLPVAARIATAAIAYVVCSLAFYRMSMFTHELVHLRSGTMLGFRTAWNLLCGIPFLIPSFSYYTHLDHHRRHHYGTKHDGEYLSFGLAPPWGIVAYLAFNLVVPLLAIFRFLVLGPVSWFIPPLRRIVLQRASSMVIDYFYVRPLPGKKECWIIFLQELLCFTWLVGVLVFSLVVLGRWPIPFLIVSYTVGVFILTINSIRTLGSHRWANDKHEELSFEGQLLDSVNVARRPWITELWGPIGTRFHSLHHLFPGLPYHAMPEAHRRLMAELPPDSPYHATEEPSLTAALLDLWQRSSTRKQRLVGTPKHASAA